MTQKIVVSLVLPITEILVIENDKLNSTFSMSPSGYKACKNQLVIKPTLIIIEGPEKTTRGGE
jgi:hypothetical protein